MLLPTKCWTPQYPTSPNQKSTFFLNQLLQTTDLNHPLNVNKKYEYLARIEPKQEVGTGYKKVPNFKIVNRLLLTMHSQINKICRQKENNSGVIISRFQKREQVGSLQFGKHYEIVFPLKIVNDELLQLLLRKNC